MRLIIEEESFADAAIALANYRAIDLALDTIRHGLMLDPYGYSLHETQITSFRYAVTNKVAWINGTTIPPLIVIFTIDQSHNVHLTHIEKFEQ